MSNFFKNWLKLVRFTEFWRILPSFIERMAQANILDCKFLVISHEWAKSIALTSYWKYFQMFRYIYLGVLKTHEINLCNEYFLRLSSPRFLLFFFSLCGVVHIWLECIIIECFCDETCTLFAFILKWFLLSLFYWEYLVN